MGFGLAAAGAGALLGAIAGGQKDRTTSGIILPPATRAEIEAGKISRESLQQLAKLFNVGPGKEDVAAGAQSQRDFAKMLEEALQTSGLPSQADIAQAQAFSEDIFAPEQEALRQAFSEQEIRTSQLAASLGRSVSDPILQAKLAQEQTRQQASLGAQQRAFSAEQARQIPLQRLQLGGTLADVRQGLASQAFANRQTLFTLGQQALQSERSFRLGQATQFQESGGGLKGAITGGLAGAGSFLQAGSQAGLFGGSSAAAPTLATKGGLGPGFGTAGSTFNTDAAANNVLSALKFGR